MIHCMAESSGAQQIYHAVCWALVTVTGKTMLHAAPIFLSKTMKSAVEAEPTTQMWTEPKARHGWKMCKNKKDNKRGWCRECTAMERGCDHICGASIADSVLFDGINISACSNVFPFTIAYISHYKCLSGATGIHHVTDPSQLELHSLLLHRCSSRRTYTW